jgi:methylmalonyl-CoA/ethylmalonyl-CoA epimerase
MIKRILEVGVAVNDIESAGEPFIELLGAEKGELFTVNQFNMNMRMFRVGNVEFELMQSVQRDGIIDRFIKKQGQGLHHIAFEVEDIIDTVHWCKTHDVEIIEDRVYEVYGIKAIFLHPKIFGGVLFELIQGNPKWVADRSLPDTLQVETKKNGIGAEGIVEVGILVNRLEDLTGTYHNVFMTEKTEIKDFPRLSLRSSTLKIGNIALHLIETISEKNYMADLIETKTLGLHHITLKIQNLDQSLGYLKDKSVNIIEETYSPFWGNRSAFLHPKAFCGIPVRLTEKMPACLT